MKNAGALRPTAGVAQLVAYRVPRSPTPVDLRLDGNEGMLPADDLIGRLAGREAELLRLYPSKQPLEVLLAKRLGVCPEEVLVTAGADDALDRVARAFLDRERHMVLPEPTFEMLTRYPAILGSQVVSVPWPSGPYPVQAVLEAITPETGVVALVTPNNPTGAVATADDLDQVLAAAPHAVVLVDHAYVEYGGEDFTARAVQHPNVVVTRSLSKAYGLAGLRLGFAVARRELIDVLAAAGSPYPVSGPSVALALDQMSRPAESFRAHVGQVHQERSDLQALLSELGLRPQESAANFILSDGADSVWLRDAMAGLGIGVRAFPGVEVLQHAVRISCPGNALDYARLEHALRTVYQPQGLLFDMDGVLADVSDSYRQAILDTAASFGVVLSAQDITAAKVAGDANNDWVLTRRLLAERGVELSLDEVTERFERAYQGSAMKPGLRDRETLLMPRQTLLDLAARLPCAVVTGRPRADMQHFLDTHELSGVFTATVCMGEAAPKPSPEPVALALQQLGVERAWMLGDTPDDVRSARAARVLPLGLAAPCDLGSVPGPEQEADSMVHALLSAGAGRVLSDPSDLVGLLP